MNKLSHPEMSPVRNTTGSNRPKPKTYVVDDPSIPDPKPNIDEQLAQFEAPRETTSLKSELPDQKSITKALEKLIFIGQLTDEIEIDNNKFKLSTLTNHEHNQVVKMMWSFSEPADLFTMRILTLANALKSINGITLDEIDAGGEFESDFHKRMSIIDHLQLSVVETLYERYEKLVKKEEEATDQDEEIKN